MRGALKARALPRLWLLSDARNDAVLETALRGWSAPVAFVYRHYHLAAGERRERFEALARIARMEGHLVVLASGAATALRWGADGYYASPESLRPRRTGLVAVATAHDLREIGRANRFGADAVMLSPVFPTRSHPGARTLGPLRFRLLARRARMPVIALGGMDRGRAERMKWERWAAIDGLSTGLPRPDA
ncbi:hypothetical protein GCM10011371_26430 [Novosphingobium marinum]|uniref:Thiamine-phosphate pyrophosphorylase n=1 Tax=Novosphingobium marinum TaxID=1514948 RepID=A0A7Y9XUK2_9SPHN|nr:thiamine phosphate synthase [Novosphingobium marinum]NYH94742.1 thiamine-phosphate pyrophosphorylase [Novosphingobium marinum]GGC37661.1 hypothetical protein GCM10011371_26430 [Novosphingobium marinum]